MQKFEKGDIIIKNSKVYIARIIGEKETLFEATSVGGMFGSKWSGCGDNESFSVKCNDYLIIGGECTHCSKTFDEKTGTLVPEGIGEYPIVGRRVKGAFFWDVPRLKIYYPSLHAEYIANQSSDVIDFASARSANEAKILFNQLKKKNEEPSKEEIVKLATAKTPAKKATKKTTKKR